MSDAKAVSLEGLKDSWLFYRTNQQIGGNSAILTMTPATNTERPWDSASLSITVKTP